MIKYKENNDEELIHKKIENIKVRNPNIEIKENLTFGQKSADKMTSVVGSWSFVIGSLIFMGFWIILNTYILVKNPIDKPPYQALNLLLSCLAALQSSVIMISQRRTEENDRTRSENDYKINLKTFELQEHLHQKIDSQSKEISKLKELINNISNKLDS